MEEELDRRKKTWMKKNKKWSSKWNIKLHECLNTKEEIKKFMDEKFRTAMWTNHSGRKKKRSLTQIAIIVRKHI
jgi:hypothetical protein